MSTVNDEDGLQHVNQEMEAKVSAPFVSDRFLSPALSLSLSIYMYIYRTDMEKYFVLIFLVHIFLIVWKLYVTLNCEVVWVLEIQYPYLYPPFVELDFFSILFPIEQSHPLRLAFQLNKTSPAFSISTEQESVIYII